MMEKQIYCIARTFSTTNNEQYNLIDLFWDEVLEHYELNDLIGVGYNWTNDTIEYAIALKDGVINNYNKIIVFPEDEWKMSEGKTENLKEIYKEIYSKYNKLRFEIEEFNSNGNCKIYYIP